MFPIHLLSLSQRVFKLDLNVQVLSFRESKDSLLTELDDDDSTLAYFGVCDGSEIFMNEKDEKAEAEKMKRDAAEEELRRAEEEERAKRMTESKKALM
mgnify:FL=1